MRTWCEVRNFAWHQSHLWRVTTCQSRLTECSHMGKANLP